MPRQLGMRKTNEGSHARPAWLSRAISSINQLIVRSQEPLRIFEEACRIAVEDGHFKMTWVGLVDEESRTVRPAASWGETGAYLDGIRVSALDVPEGNGPTGTCIRTGAHFICNDIAADPSMSPWRMDALRHGFRSCGAFPIRQGGRVVGAFMAYSDGRRFADEDEVRLLDELAVDISFALENIRRDEKRRQTEDALKSEVEATTALLKAAEIISAYLNWDEVTAKVLNMLIGMVGCESAAVFMIEDGTLVPFKAMGGPEGAKSFFYTIRPGVDEVPAVGLALKRRQPLIVGRKEQGRLLPDYLYRYLAIKEAIIAPILARDRVPGLLAVNFRRLTEEARALMIVQGIACQMGVAYENARLYEDAQKQSLDLAKKIEVLEVLHEIDRLILSTHDREEMLPAVVQKVRRLVPADVGAVALMDEDGLNFRLACGWRLDMVEGEVLPAASCPAVQTFKSRKTKMRPNLANEKRLSRLDKAFRDAGCMSDMLIPIMSKGAGVGFIRLGSLRVAGFSMEDVSVADKLAYQVGIAIENSRLITDLEEMLVNTVTALTAAIDAKSPWTKGHSVRVTEFATAIATKMGLPGADVERLRLAGLLHDVGKIGTYDVILDKPTMLTDEEFGLVKKHPDRGCEILGPIKQFKDLLPIIRSHHERVDGRGYPAGLKGEEIPLMARILCVADAYDSMTADRPYRPAPGKDYALNEFAICSNSQFDPEVVEAFLDII